MHRRTADGHTWTEAAVGGAQAGRGALALAQRGEQQEALQAALRKAHSGRGRASGVRKPEGMHGDGS